VKDTQYVYVDTKLETTNKGEKLIGIGSTYYRSELSEDKCNTIFSDLNGIEHGRGWDKMDRID
jgi:hypothetical protein